MCLITVDPKENSGEGFAITRSLCENTLFPEKTKTHSRVLFPFLTSSGWYLPYNLKNYFWVLEKINDSSIYIWRIWKWPNRERTSSLLIPPTALGWQLSFLCYLHTSLLPRIPSDQVLFTAFPNSSARLTFAFLTAAYSKASQSLSNLYPLLIGKDTKNSGYEHGCLQRYQTVREAQFIFS